jgi:hypothetical protein
MAMKPCWECKGLISDTALFCPHCGADNSMSPRAFKFLKGFAHFLMIVMIALGVAILWAAVGMEVALFFGFVLLLPYMVPGSRRWTALLRGTTRDKP